MKKHRTIFCGFRGLFAGALIALLPAAVQAAAPTITSAPTGLTAPAGSTVSFTVVATGSGTLTYQWQQDGHPVSGANSTLSLTNISDSSAGGYTAIVSSGGSSVTSSPPAVLIVTHPPVITSPPANQVVAIGDQAFFSVGVNGAVPLAYQWLKDGVNFDTQTNSTLDLMSAAPSDAGSYSLYITNADGSNTSPAALLTIVDPQLAASQPLNVPINTCTNLIFTVTTYGTEALHYQWFFGDTPVGVDAPSFTNTDISFGSAGVYSVDVFDAGSSATASATITVQDTPPVIINGPANVVVQTGPGNNTCSMAATWAPPTALDNCPGVTLTANFNPGHVFPVGTNTVTYTATDSASQTATYSFTVTVQDTTPPVPVFNTISIQLDATGNDTLSPADVAAIAAGSSDTCGSVSNSVSPSTFTFCDVGSSKPVILTVTDASGNVATANGTITVLAPTAVPSVVYVDASYSGCGPVTFPNAMGTGAYYVGYNAFATIGAGVSHVATNGTVNVAGGRYVEEVSINKALALLGPNATNNPISGTRVMEAVIQPDTADPEIYDPNPTTMISLGASQVTIKGFTIDGYNPDLAGPTFASGTDLFNAASGIADYSGASYLRIENNIVKNDAYAGVDLESDLLNSPPTTNNRIRGNLIENMDYNTEGYGIGVILYNNDYAEIAGNDLTNVTIGISPQSFFLANPGDVRSQSIRSNNVSASLLGLWLNLVYESASTFDLTGNTSAFAPTNGAMLWAGPEWDGIEITSIQSAVNVLMTNNTVIGTTNVVGYNTVGYNIWNTPTTGAVVIGGGSVSNADYGVWVNNFDGYGSPTGTTQATIAGLDIAGSSLAGVYVQDDPQADTNAPVQVTLTGNTSISGGAVGILLDGGSASAAPGNTALTAVGANYIQLTNSSTNGMDATAVVFDGNTGATMTLPQLYATEDRIWHQVDNASLGFVRVKAANVYVTTASGSIQRGINAASLADTVNVSAGSFNEADTIPQQISLVGAGSGTDPSSATIVNGGASPAMTLTAGGADATDRLKVAQMRLTGLDGVFIDSTISYITLDTVAAANCPSYGVELHNNASVTDLLLNNCLLDSCNIGLRKSSTGLVNGLSILNGTINGNVEGIYAAQNPGVSATAFNNIAINGTVFSSNTSKGIYVEALSQALWQNLLFTNCGTNGSFGAGININLKYGIYANVQILNSAFFNCGTGDAVNGSALDIEARDDVPSYNGNPATLTGVTLSGLTVTGAPDGIRFGETAKGNAGPLNVTVLDCSLVGNIVNGIRNESLATTLAQSNWWGSVRGPASATLNPYGTGVGVSGLVNFSPWLGDGTDTSGAIGFQPNAAPVYLPPTHLAFGPQPGGANLGSALSPQPAVSVLDINNNLTPWANPAVTASLGANPGGGVLAGDSVETAAGGVATFNNLSVTVGGGANFTLVAAAPFLSSATSGFFNVSNPVPSIASLSPFWTRSGGVAFSLTVNGANFVPSSVVDWNGSARNTHFVSSTQVTADIAGGDIATAGTVPVTVVNPAPGGGTTGALNFQVEDATPMVVYVDGNYTGKPADTLVNFPDNGNPGSLIIGYNAFATVSGGISAVATNGTVNVAAGNYVEDVTIDRSLSLIGPNAAINPNTGSRVPEAVLRPFTSDPDPNSPTAEIVVYVAVTNVTIEGITVDGDNTNVTSGIVVGGADVDAAEGIVSYEGVGAITVANNIIRNTSYTGVDFYNYNNNGGATSGNYLQSNLLSNIGYVPYGFGIGVLVYNNFYADISENVMTNVRLGVQTGNFFQANPGTTQSISNNAIYATQVGIFHNLAYAQASPLNITGNTISLVNEAGSSGWDGMEITSMQDGVGVNLAGNLISASPQSYPTVGYKFWNTPTTNTLTVNGGSVSSVSYGVELDNYHSGYGDGAASVIAVAGAGINNASLAGVYALDDALSTSHNRSQVVVTSNTVINSSAAGVLARGTNAFAQVINNTASITGNAIGVDVDAAQAMLQNNDLTGNTVAAIRVENGGTVDAGNCTGTNVTGLGVSTGGNNLSGYGFGGMAPWAIINNNAGGMPVVLAEHDNFGAVAGDNIRAAFSDPAMGTVYSQSPAVIVAPSNLNLTCASSVPAGAVTLAGFTNQGGYFSAGVATVGFVDSTNLTGSGLITRIYTVMDSCASPSVVTQTITVSDTTPPVISGMPGNFHIQTGPGYNNCTEVVTWPEPTASDNCTVASFTANHHSGDAFPIGETTVTYIAVDTSSNATTNSFTVTVQDTTPPVIVTCATNRMLTADTNAQAMIPDLRSEVIATDCSTPVVISQTPPPLTVVGLGNQVVTLTATDAAGNPSVCTATINVIDATPPVLNCVSNITVTVLQSKDPYFTGRPTATDAGGPVVIAFTDDRTGLTNCDSTGVILRTWTATDPSSNVSTCVQTVTVVDNVPPVFTALSTNITTTNDPGLCSALINYLMPAAVDIGYFEGFENPNYASGDPVNQPSVDWNDFSSHVSAVPSGTDGIVSRGGAAHGVIDSTVAPAAGDNTGAYSRLGGYSSVFGAGFRVAQDIYINLNDPAVLNATATSGYTWDLSAAASDQSGNYLRDFIFHAAAYDSTGVVLGADNNSADSVLTRGGDLRLFPNHTTLTNSGWYRFQWLFRNTNNVLAVDLNVTDTNHNVLFTQTLSDPGDLISTVVGGHRYLWFTFLAVDKLAIDNTVLQRIAPVTSSMASGVAFPVGTTTVTNTIADACGNTTNATFTVTVNDVEPPVITCPSNLVVGVDSPHGDAVVNFLAPVVTDNCGISNITTAPASGSHFPIGTTFVNTLATDIHGNSNSCSFSVTVIDVPIFATQPVSLTNIAGTTATFTVSVTSPVPVTYQWNKGGVPLSDGPRISGSMTNVLTIANVSDADVAGYTVTVSNLAGPATSTPATLTVIDPVLIVSSPMGLTTNVGSPVSFSVTATGTGPLGYQWQQNNVNILGATSSTYAIAAAADSDVGSYRVIVTNLISSVTSAPPAVLTLLHPPVIPLSGQPTNVTVAIGQSAAFNVSANGVSPFLYQWRKDDINLNGQTNRVLTLLHVQDADAGHYSVFVTNSDGSTTSREALLTVLDPPVITTQPVGLTNNALTTASFTVVVTGSAPLGYHWIKNGTNLLADGGNISGSTNATLVISNVLVADAGLYSVVITNAVTSVTSSNAALVVIDPLIVTQPVSRTNNAATTASFTVVAAGTSPFFYQWVKNGTNFLSDGGNVSGSTNATLVLANVLAADRGTYSVIVSNTNSAAGSSNATLTVIDPVIVSQPSNASVVIHSTVQFTVVANGTSPLLYQWMMNDFPLSDGFGIGGSQGPTLSITNVTDSDEGDYSVFVSGPGGSVFSMPASLITHLPLITGQPITHYVNLGQPTSLSVIVNGAIPFVYQWQKNDTNIDGATNRILNFGPVADSDGANYRVIVANPEGTETSSEAGLIIVGPTVPILDVPVYQDGQAAVALTSTPGLSFALQASTNLTDWTSLITNTAPFIFMDTNASNFNPRFYRGLYLP